MVRVIVMRRYFDSYLHSTSPNRISLILGGSQAEINDFVPNPTEEAHALPRITQFIVSRTSCLEPRSPQERPLQGQAPNSGRSLGRGFLVRIPGERKFKRTLVCKRSKASLQMCPDAF